MIRFHLPNAEKGEKIIMLLRRHWFIMFARILFWMIAAVLPIIFYFIFVDVFGNFLTAEIIYPIFILFVVIYYLYIWLFAFSSFVDYYLDIWIVTNKRIINIEQKGLFYRQVSEQRLFRIQDVTSDLEGFFSTVINYGNVTVQTAGAQQKFMFKQVPNPRGVTKKIIQMVEQEKKYQRLLERKDKINT